MFKIFGEKRSKGEILKLEISGLHCTSCSLNIDGTLEDIEGVIRANTSYAKSQTIVEYDQEKISSKKIAAAVKKLGYKVKII